MTTILPLFCQLIRMGFLIWLLITHIGCRESFSCFHFSWFKGIAQSVLADTKSILWTLDSCHTMLFWSIRHLNRNALTLTLIYKLIAYSSGSDTFGIKKLSSQTMAQQLSFINIKVWSVRCNVFQYKLPFGWLKWTLIFKFQSGNMD